MKDRRRTTVIRFGEWRPIHELCRACGKHSPTTIYCSDECAADCPHGERRADCNACDVESDLAFDAGRERGK